MAAIEVETILLLVAGVSITALGLGSAFVASTTTAMSPVQPLELGVASGIINPFHELGAALGVATISVIAAGSLAQPQSSTGFVSAYATAAFVALGVAVIAALLVPAGRPAADAPRFAH